VTSHSHEIKGFRFAAVAAGIKKAGTERLDLGLIVADAPAAAAAVTTTNLVYAAPVAVTRERARNGLCQAILANSGNANAYTGDNGLRDAVESTRLVADGLGIVPDLVIPMSTGVIGQALPMGRMAGRIPDLLNSVGKNSYADFAAAIMTTDTRPKTVSLDGELSTGPVRMLGIAKGSGMIAPNMATMLAVVLVDVRVEPALLHECLVEANKTGFNVITVDGDMSTNDTLVVLAGGRPDAPRLGKGDTDRDTFSGMLAGVCGDLARQMVLDGEGATKLVEIHVRNAPDKTAADRVARTIAESLLVKTAFRGEDPNWGRIISAAGRAGVDFNPSAVDLTIGEVLVVKDGSLVDGDWEPRAAKVMQRREFSVTLDLKSGRKDAVILTTDLSEEYVRINADYRT
jgi:glutamate N-acetyltransferase / amino-acid N-acetyltransferase